MIWLLLVLVVAITAPVVLVVVAEVKKVQHDNNQKLNTSIHFSG